MIVNYTEPTRFQVSLFLKKDLKKNNKNNSNLSTLGSASEKANEFMAKRQFNSSNAAVVLLTWL